MDEDRKKDKIIGRLSPVNTVKGKLSGVSTLNGILTNEYSGLTLGETSTTAYRGDRGKIAYDHATDEEKLTISKDLGFYKIATTSEGHIASVKSVTKTDITNLGIPGEEIEAGSGLVKVNNTLNHSNSIEPGTIGNSSETSGPTINIPYANYDGQGHIISGGTHVHTINNLSTSDISSGTFGDERIASSSVWNSKQDQLSFDGTYDASTNKVATVSTITDVIESLDGGEIGTPGVGKTIASLSEEDGQISATFEDINITKSQISDFPSTMPPSSHTHGNITNDGDITSVSDISSGDRIVINDESGSRITNSSITFGTSETTFLNNKGTWTTPAGLVTSVNSKSGDVVLNAEDVGALSDDTEIPEKTSDLINDSGYLTSGDFSGVLPIIIDGTTFIHANSGVAAASKGDILNQSPGFGDNFKVLSGTVNATGHLTEFADHTVTIPNATATDEVAGLMSATDKIKLDGVAPGATVDDHKWNDVQLNKNTVTSQNSVYVPTMAGISENTANLTQATATPTANAIAKYDNSTYLTSTTPTISDDSTKVATTAFVNSVVDDAISGLGSVLDFKGTKNTKSELPLSGNTTGDVWIVTEDNSEFVWDGSKWEELGTTTDLSGYLQINNLAAVTGTSTVTAMTQKATTDALNEKAQLSHTHIVNDITDFPVNVSSFVNDVGYLTDYTETDPTVPSWAKANTKPSYTYSEVGAAAENHVHSQYAQTVNGATVDEFGEITLSPSDIDAAPEVHDHTVSDITDFPTNVSAFTNDAGYLTTEVDPTVPAWAKESTKPSYTYSEVGAAPVNHTHITTDVTDFPTNVSTFNNDAGYLTSYTETDPTVPTWAKTPTKPTYTYSEVGAAPTNHTHSEYAQTVNGISVDNAGEITLTPSDIGAADTSHTHITSDITNFPTNVSSFINDAGYLTTEIDPTVPSWAKASTKPSYTYSEVGAAAESHTHVTDDITDFPTNVSEFTNDAGYLTTETDPTVPSWAKENTKPTYTYSEVGAAAASHTHLTNDITDFPTNVSEFTNDAGYLTGEIDPTVPSWAKEPNKPSYTYSEVGAASANHTHSQYAETVNGVSVDNNGEITLNPEDIGASAENHTHTTGDITNFPTNVSTFTNDVGYLTTETDPTVSAWAKAPTKPTYTYSEVGAAASSHEHVINDITDFPTDVSSFNNDAGYLTTESDPTVPSWAKTPTKPTYTAAEIGAAEEDHTHIVNDITDFPTNVSSFINDVGYLTTEIDPTVPSWAKAPNKPSYTAAEVGALPDDTPIPSKTSDLTNDSGFLTTETDPTVPSWAKANTKPSYTYSEVGAAAAVHEHIVDDITDFPTDVSSFINDVGYLTSETDPTVPSWAKTPSKPTYTATEVGAAEEDHTHIIDDITDFPTNVSSFVNDAGYLTSYTETDPTVPSWAKAPTKPSYTYSEVGAAASNHEHLIDDITNFPTNVSDFDNDVGYLTVETDPTVPAWAKMPNKPSYTAAEVGAAPVSHTHSQYAQSVNGIDVDEEGDITIDIPSKTSDLVNDSGFITGYTETDPTVPSWAKEATKPTYTYSEVGAAAASHTHVTDEITDFPTNVSSFTNDAGYLTTEVDPTVPSWAKTPTKPSYTYSEVGAAPALHNHMVDDITDFPTDVSSFNNDAGYLTTETDPTVPNWAKASTKPSYTYNEVGAAAAIHTHDINDITDFPTEVSAFINDAGYLTSETDPTVPNWAKQNTKPSYTYSEVGAAAASHTHLTEDITDFPTEISTFNNDVGYLTTETDPVFTASAAHGITSVDISNWNNKSDFSGNYNDLTNRPSINGVTLSGNKTLADLDNRFIVILSEDLGVLSADKTGNEIKSAYFDGKEIVVTFGGFALPMSLNSFYDVTEIVTFSAVIKDTDNAVKQELVTLTIGNPDTWDIKITNLTAGENFIITVDFDLTPVTADKTRTEIIEAIEANKNIYVKFPYYPLIDAMILMTARLDAQGDVIGISGSFPVRQNQGCMIYIEYELIGDNWNRYFTTQPYTPVNYIVDPAEYPVHTGTTGDETGDIYVKAYSTVGSNTDGTMTQNAITTALSGKAALSHTHITNDITNFPTNVSAFTNDAGYLTSYTETDPTVPAWAKASSKPSYTYNEVGAAPSNHEHIIDDITDFPTEVSAFANDAGYLTTETDPTVPAWAKTTNKPTYTYNEVGAAAEDHTHITDDITDFPTNVSTFTNDAGYLTVETDPTVPSWAKSSTKPSYTYSEVGAAAASHTHDVNEITDFPTDVSTFNNDVGYLTTETDPTVPNWAKAASKPTYTYSEVGAAPTNHTHSQYAQSVNGIDVNENGEVTLAPSDIGAAASNHTHVVNNITDFPTGVSAFTNDAGYLTSETDPTVPSWAKASVKPSYTYSEVGAAAASHSHITSDITNFPTDVSEFTNDAGYLTTETDPTVPSWAKAANKPSYTASEVGALPDDTPIPSKTSDLVNDSGFITGYTETDPTVPAWAKASTKPTYTYSEVGAAPSSHTHTTSNITDFPTTVSTFTNDAGYLTIETDPTVPSWAKTVNKPSYTASEVGALPDDTFIPSKTSDITNDSGFITANDISGKADDSSVVHIAGAETVTGKKTFTSPVIIQTDSAEGFNLKSSTAGGYLYVTRGVGSGSVQMAIKSGLSGGTFGTTTNHQFQFRTNDVARITVGTDGSVKMNSDVPANSNDNQVATTKWVNAKGYLTSYTETDPTVPAWAKASTKPTYTASEVGALPDTTPIPSKTSDLTNDSGFITGYTETDPTVPAWAKASSKPSYTAAEVGALPDTTSIPSKTSDLTNDSGFITSASVPSATTTSPKMDGTAAVGSETKWAKGDHVHPTDTSRQVKITANGLLKGDGSGTITAAVAGTDYAAASHNQALSTITGADDLKAIEALSGTNGLLKKTAANTWALDTTSYLSSETDPTVPSWAKAQNKPSYTADEITGGLSELSTVQDDLLGLKDELDGKQDEIAVYGILKGTGPSSGTKTYTVSGIGTTPVALPSELDFPDELTEGFVCTAEWSGEYEDRQGDTHQFSLTGSLREIGTYDGHKYIDFYGSNLSNDLYFNGVETGFLTLEWAGYEYASGDYGDVILSTVSWSITITPASGTKTYTVSGTGETPVAIPEGLSIPDEITEEFTATCTASGMNYNDDPFDFEATLSEIMIDPEYGKAMFFYFNETQYESRLAVLVEETTLTGYAVYNGIGSDNYAWAITFTDSSGSGSGIVAAIPGVDYVVTETDPTVPSWAKQSTKPNYEADEITGGLTESTTVKDDLESLQSDIDGKQNEISVAGILKGHGSGIVEKSYTIEGLSDSAVVLPSGLDIPEQLQEGFSGYIDFNGYYVMHSTDGDLVTEEYGYAPLSSISVSGDSLILTFNVNYDPETGDLGCTATAAVSDGEIVITYAAMQGESLYPLVLDNPTDYPLNWSIVLNTYGEGSGYITAAIPGIDYVESESDPVFLESPASWITETDIVNWDNKSDFSGSYNDLTDKPTIPTDSNLVHKTGAETVAGTKSFTDAMQVSRTTSGPILKLSSSASDTNFILERTNGAQCVLESGATVGLFGTKTNHSLQVRTNYVNRMTFDTSGGVTLATAPAANSNNNQLATTKWVNDKGYLTSYTETDPTVPSWAKASTKPTYTASEVGALPSSTVIPSKTSDLTNDSGFITGYTETDPTVPAWAKASSKPTYTYSEVGAASANHNHDSDYLRLDGTEAMRDDLDMGGSVITNLADPLASDNAATKNYVDTSIGNLGDLATINKPSSDQTTKYLRGDGAWQPVAAETATKAYSIPFGNVTSNSTTVFTATVPGVTSLYDGLICYIRNNNNQTSASGWTLNVNELGAKPVYNTMADATAVTTTFNKAYTMMFIYNSSRVSGGCWDMYYGYYSNTTMAYGHLDYYFRARAGQAIYRYKYVMQGEDNRLYPITTTNQTSATQVAKAPTTVGLRPGHIWYYSTTTTISAGSAIGAQTLQAAGYATTAAYNFNTSISTYRMVYLRGTYDKDKDLFYLYNDGSSPCTSYYTQVPSDTADITLSDYFVEGYYYILLGGSYSTANYLSNFADNPLYYFDGTNLIPASTMVAKDIADSATTAIITQINQNIVNRNLLDNPWFQVNQKDGETQFQGKTNGETCIDRWYLYGTSSEAKWNATTNLMEITTQYNNTSTMDGFYQNVLKGPSAALLGKKIVLSVMGWNGEIKELKATMPASVTGVQSYVLASQNFTLPSMDPDSSENISFYLYIAISKVGGQSAATFNLRVGAKTAASNKSITIKAMKLEVGDFSTLANDMPPNYMDELEKCKHYYRRLSGPYTMPCTNNGSYITLFIPGHIYTPVAGSTGSLVNCSYSGSQYYRVGTSTYSPTGINSANRAGSEGVQIQFTANSLPSTYSIGVYTIGAAAYLEYYAIIQ